MPKFTTFRDDLTFVDAHGVTIHYYAWRAAKPVGVVQIAHGLGEYAGRYENLAQELVNAGYSVYADDHRGHGRTGLEQHNGDATKLGRLGPGGLRAAADAIHQLSGIIRSELPGVPLAVVGHSWGSLMVQWILNKHAADYDAAVLTGTAYRVPGQMKSGPLNAAHKHLGSTGYEWLSRDPLVAQAFLEDPLTFYADARKLFGVRDGLHLYGLPSRTLGNDLPLLIMIGSEDPLGGERSVRELANAYIRRSHLTDVKVTVFAGARHDIFNETNRDEVIADLIAWLGEHLGDSTPEHDDK
ncbi:alpha-beta hydrolase superfamily lysophospholipase [Glaciihabitans tibetensis]|uniref:Alpha-beta hydrolase superfamily lysophospholipase n=1 Tax=Glaciihabitans tibetensis TaxID=1266600 RepID=A0A2T0V9R6_9MICO|nr:alpha/beta hydrolase [Glaciihabitans tibetensis]PRY66935.1 alpha-beta hydrolase superfamily lysophospholipase [Glaciihabitans tibetensis]